MFHLSRSPADLALLKQRNTNLSHTSPGKLSVNIVLPGLGDILGICSVSEAPTQAAPLAEIPTNTLAVKISLDEFCTQYTLTNNIHLKLMVFKITSPHSLHFLSDDILAEKVKLDPAEIGDVCDAQERWSTRVES